MDLKQSIGKNLDNNEIRFDINPKYGHIFGTVIRVLQAKKGDKSNLQLYNVVWEYTAYGESDLPMSVLLDAHKVAESITTTTPANRTRQQVKQKLRIQEKLSTISDEENLTDAPLSDFCNSDTACDSIGSDFDWTLFNNGDPYLEKKLDLELDGSNVEPSASATPTTGIHWEYQGSITTTSTKKMPLCSTKVRIRHEKLFKSPIQSVMAVFPLIFWETIRDELIDMQSLKLLKETLITK